MFWDDIDIPDVGISLEEGSSEQRGGPRTPSMMTAVDLDGCARFAKIVERVVSDSPSPSGRARALREAMSLSDEDQALLRKVGDRLSLYDVLISVGAPLSTFREMLSHLRSFGPCANSFRTCMHRIGIDRQGRGDPLTRIERWLMSTQCSFLAAVSAILDSCGDSSGDIVWRVLFAAATARPHRPDWETVPEGELVEEDAESVRMIESALAAASTRRSSGAVFQERSIGSELSSLARECGVSSAYLSTSARRHGSGIFGTAYDIVAALVHGRLRIVASSVGTEETAPPESFLKPRLLDGLSFMNGFMVDAVLPHGILPERIAAVHVRGGAGASVPCIPASDGGLDVVLVPVLPRTCDAVRRVYGLKGRDPLVVLDMRTSVSLSTQSPAFPDAFSAVLEHCTNADVFYVGTRGIGWFVGSDEPPSPEEMFHVFALT